MSEDLRPYYNPDTFDPGYLVIYKPGVGLVNTLTGKSITSSIHPVMNTSGGNYNPGANIGLRGYASINKDAGTFEKDYFNDLEFLEYFDLNNLSALLKNLFWNFFKNYCKTLVLQPLEITRLVLQVGKFDFEKQSKRPHKLARLLESSAELTPTPSLISDDDDSDFEASYFQSTNDLKESTIKSPSKSKKQIKKRHKIHPISKHTVDIVSAIVAKDGPNALFRGLNAQFIHQTLSHTIEAWITGFLSPFLGIPDPFFLDLTRSTDPLKSLCLSVLACVLTGFILMPLDLVKVKLMITQFNKPYNREDVDGLNLTSSLTETPVVLPQQNTRSIRESIRNYPTHYLLNPPIYVTFLTGLHQFSTSIFRKSSPYLLFIRFNIDAYLSPKLYTLSNLVLLIMEFFIKLPVENLLRKEQVKFLLQPKTEDEKNIVTITDPDHNLIVDFNDGWNQEVKEPNRLKAIWKKLVQLGLFNGWRVGVLNIIGFWGYEIVKSGASVREEKL